MSDIAEVSDLMKFESPVLSQIRELYSKSLATTGSMMDDLRSRLDREIQSWDNSSKMVSDEWTSSINKLDYDEWMAFIRSHYHLDSQLDAYVLNSVSSNSDWRGSAMVFRTNDPEYFKDMISFYPIYVVEKYPEKEAVIKEMFHPAQLRKIRFYNLDQADLLPQNAMKFIVSINHFTHASWERMVLDLRFMRSLIKTGGTIAFNFNDCEWSTGAKLFESKMRSYILGNNVRACLAELGLAVTHWQRLPDMMTTWVEAVDTNQWTSIKLTETLGKIMRHDR